MEPSDFCFSSNQAFIASISASRGMKSICTAMMPNNRFRSAIALITLPGELLSMEKRAAIAVSRALLLAFYLWLQLDERRRLLLKWLGSKLFFRFAHFALSGWFTSDLQKQSCDHP